MFVTCHWVHLLQVLLALLGTLFFRVLTCCTAHYLLLLSGDDSLVLLKKVSLGNTQQNAGYICVASGPLFTWCCGFAWQGFGFRGSTGVASVRSCQKLSPYLIEPVPAGSKMDLLLAKGKPISDSGSTSGITYLRRAKKSAVGQQLRQRSETM